MNRVRMAGVAAVVAVLSAPAVFAAAVTLRASSAEVAPGSEFPIVIDISGAKGIGAMHIELGYDPSVATAESVAPGPAIEGGQMVPNLKSPGKVVLAIASGKSMPGQGQVATITFKALGGRGQQSEVHFDISKCSVRGDDEAGLQLLLEAHSGSIQLTGLPWLPIGGGAAGLLLLIVLGVALARKKGPAAALCAQCGAPITGAAQFCPKCGKPLAPPATGYCSKCGAPIQGDSRFCAKCGSPRS